MTSARPPEAKASAKDVFINHERKLEDRRRSDTALVLTLNDANHQSARSTLFAGSAGSSLSRETRVSGFRGESGCKAET